MLCSLVAIVIGGQPCRAIIAPFLSSNFGSKCYHRVGNVSIDGVCIFIQMLKWIFQKETRYNQPKNKRRFVGGWGQ